MSVVTVTAMRLRRRGRGPASDRLGFLGGQAFRARSAAGCLCVGLMAAASFAQAANAYTAYVSNLTEQTLSPINTATGIVSSTIAAKNPPFLAITPDGSTAWVTNSTQGTVTPVTLSTGRSARR